MGASFEYLKELKKGDSVLFQYVILDGKKIIHSINKLW
jgi:Cu/Ag efflux protein CusF